MFIPDEIKDGGSYRKLKKDFGGRKGLLTSLHTDASKGIDHHTVHEREKVYGDNKPLVKKMTTFIEFVWECFEDLTLRILLVAALVSLILGLIHDPSTGWLEGVAIFFAVAIVVIVTSVNNYLKELKFRKLSQEAHQRNIPVMRDGKEMHVSVFDLVVGDIAKIGGGDVMPVDAMVLFSSNLLTDESAMTGEADMVKKSKKQTDKSSPFLLSGSQVSNGNATVVVLTVGANTFSGKILKGIQEDEEGETPLQMKLNGIAELIGKIGLAMALLTFIVLIIKGIVIFDTDEVIESIYPFLDGFIIAVTIVVVAVPEGLPLAVTLSLAFSVNEMKKKNNLVRHLDASETMGQATNICSDKTGTLTQNIMKVVSMSVGGEVFENTNKDNLHEQVIEHLGEQFCHNTNASIGFTDGKETFTGSRTEIALLKLGKEWGYDYEERRDPKKIRMQVPFNSEIKKMITVVNVGSKTYVFLKGASEVVLNVCEKIIDKNNNVEHLHHSMKEKINSEVISNYASRAYRTLGFAYKVIDNEHENFYHHDGSVNYGKLEDDLIFIAIFGIQDPIRPGVPKAVADCHKAGITVRMVTGDNKETAVAIARTCGILNKDYHLEENDKVVMTGFEFRTAVEGLVVDKNDPKIKRVGNMTAFKEIVAKLRVLSRSSPEDKLILVTGLRDLNEVVAVTGDGSNDAPALKRSNVGFAMHLAGTQLAQEASDIILLDDNFASIVIAILWGRNIYDCISKFIQFQLTVNVVALSMSFIGAMNNALSKESLPQPITAVQMLWVNLIMDTFAALALATEPPNDSLLDRKPVKHDDSLLTPDMFKTIIGQCIYQMIWLIPIYFYTQDAWNYLAEDNVHYYGKNDSCNKYENTKCIKLDFPYALFFQVFVMLQVFNEINCRKLKSSELNVFKGFFNNSIFLLIVAFTIIVQVLIVTFGGAFLNVQQLNLRMHIFALVVGAGGLIFGVLFRLLPVKLFKCIHIKEEEKPAGGITGMVKKKTTRRVTLH